MLLHSTRVRPARPAPGALDGRTHRGKRCSAAQVLRPSASAVDDAATAAAAAERVRRANLLAAQLAALKAENERLRGSLGAEELSAASVVPAPPPTPSPPAAPAKKPAAPKRKAASGDSNAVVWPERGEAFWSRPPRELDTSGTSAPPPARDGSPLHIVHLACEMAPWAKVGGLADVTLGLSRACLARGHTVDVVLPFYSDVEGTGVHVEHLTHECDFDVPKGRSHDGQTVVESVRTSAFRAEIGGVPVALLRPASGDASMFRTPYNSRGGVNETESSLYFCRAALQYLCSTGRKPAVLHIHEWQTAAAAMLYWEVYQGCLGSGIVLTIHNADSTGECRYEQFAASGCDAGPFMTIERALDERTIGHNPQRLCLLKGGIVYSNAVTTVSRTYRDETLRNTWLGGVLKQHAGKYSGIVNGIDSGQWDPTSDPFLPLSFDATTAAAGKAAMKKYVQRGLGLAEDPAAPLVVVVSRLVAQKGIHLLHHAVQRCEALGAQLVLLGTGSQDGGFKKLVADNKARFVDGPSCRLLIFYNEPLAHCLFGAGDMTLVPSLFVPCGLTQMVGQRYGCVPVVRRTGGLADTVEHGRTGFVFDGTDASSLDGALEAAVRMYREQPGEWQQLVGNCMDKDVSWQVASQEYVDLYRRVMAAMR